MDRIFGPFSGDTYSLLRIVAGFLFLCHGAQKFGLIQDTSALLQGAQTGAVREQHSGAEIGVAGTTPVQLGPQLRFPTERRLVAGVIEVIGGTLIMIGLLTTWAAFIASGLMAFAYFLAHAPQGFYPLFNRGEPAVLFCFIWLYVATRPPEPLALDNVVFRRRSDRTRESSRLPRAS